MEETERLAIEREMLLNQEYALQARRLEEVSSRSLACIRYSHSQSHFSLSLLNNKSLRNMLFLSHTTEKLLDLVVLLLGLCSVTKTDLLQVKSARGVGVWYCIAGHA